MKEKKVNPSYWGTIKAKKRPLFMRQAAAAAAAGNYAAAKRLSKAAVGCVGQHNPRLKGKMRRWRKSLLDGMTKAAKRVHAAKEATQVKQNVTAESLKVPGDDTPGTV